MIASIRGSERWVAGFKSEGRPASDRNRWPASYWNAWPASSESAQRRARPLGGVRAYLLMIDSDHAGVAKILAATRKRVAA
jgi:hypothetical protein